MPIRKLKQPARKQPRGKPPKSVRLTPGATTVVSPPDDGLIRVGDIVPSEIVSQHRTWHEPQLSRLSPLEYSRILHLIRMGASDSAAAMACGVTLRSFILWRRKGREPRAPKLYRNFARDLEEARAAARFATELRINNSDPKFWLERMARDRVVTQPDGEDELIPGWGRIDDKQVVEVIGLTGATTGEAQQAINALLPIAGAYAVLEQLGLLKLTDAGRQILTSLSSRNNEAEARNASDRVIDALGVSESDIIDDDNENGEAEQRMHDNPSDSNPFLLRSRDEKNGKKNGEMK